jgi:hypothetical protein
MMLDKAKARIGPDVHAPTAYLRITIPTHRTSTTHAIADATD